MYKLTGVARPRPQADRLHELAGLWRTVAQAAHDAAAEANAARAHIMDHNDGAAADEFTQATDTSRHDSSVRKLTELSEAAALTAQAHRSAACINAEGLAAMDAVCAASQKQLAKAWPVPSAGPSLAEGIINACRDRLLRLQEQMRRDITQAYACLNLPGLAAPPPDAAQGDGELPQDLRTAWEKMPEEERRAVVQCIADEQAIAGGLPPKPVLWDSTAEAHWDCGDGTLHINPDHVGDPHILRTIVHETRHGLHSEMVARHVSMDEQERQAVAEAAMPDPFTDYGSNIEQADRFAQNQAGGHVHTAQGTHSGAWRDHYRRALEQDAQPHGGVDDITIDTLDRYRQ